jgi:hypothetical protein
MFPKLIKETRGFERGLSSPGVQIERASLVAHVRRSFGFVDGTGNRIDLKEAGKEEARGTSANDNNLWVRHL